MGFRWLVNAGLLALPVGCTVGILMGVDSHRQATGQEPLFTGDGSTSTGGGVTGGGKGDSGDDRVTESTYCQLQVAVSPPSKGTRYVLNPNQWGYTEGTPGGLCMNVTAFHNGSYATTYTAPEFSVTWQYPPGPETQPVHAFPSIQLDRVLPLKLNALKNINVEMEWTYGIGDEPVATTDVAALDLELVNTNVAMDMFLDENEKNSQNSSKAGYEVMVWFADFGPAAQPIGLKAGIVDTQIINGTTFNLYTGRNGFNQSVFTWLSPTMTEKFHGDINPLLTALSSVASVDFPLADLYMGHLGVGSEAFSSNVNVTFSVPTLMIDIET